MDMLAGVDHIAVVTADLDRFVESYCDVFDLGVVFRETTPEFSHAIIRTGPTSRLHPAEVDGSAHVHASPSMFDRGAQPLDPAAPDHRNLQRREWVDTTSILMSAAPHHSDRQRILRWPRSRCAICAHGAHIAHRIVAVGRFQRTVDRVEALAPTVLAGCHTPAVNGAAVKTAIANTRRSPGATYAPQPDQSVLDQIQRTLGEQVAA